MIKKNRFIKFILYLILIFCPIQAGHPFSLGPIHIGGWGGGLLDDAGGLMGKPMELLTGGAIKNMHDSLDANITHLDSVMSRNARLFTNNFDSVLKWRENQLDTVLTNNINTLRDNLGENIDQLSITLQNDLAGIERLGHNTKETTWRYIKLIADLALIIITVYFIFLSYNQSKTDGSLTFETIKTVFKKIRFYVIGLGLALLIIYVFRPIAGKDNDKEYQDKVSGEETKLRTALKYWNFSNAITQATYLTYLKNDNLYTYGLAKLYVWKNLFIVMRGAKIPKSENLAEQFDLLTEYYKQYNIKDPEYYIISALFKKYFFHSKQGYLIASLDCFKYLENKNVKYDNLYNLDLLPYSYDIIQTYFLNPYDTGIVRLIFNKNKIKITEKELKLFSKDDFNYLHELSDYHDMYIKHLGYYQLVNDEQIFSKLLKHELQKEDKEELADIWIRNLGFLTEQDDIKVASNTALTWNDFLAHEILKNYRNSVLDSLTQNVNNQIPNLGTNLSIKNEISTIGIFKKQLLWWRIKDSQDDFARAGNTNKLINETNYFYSKLDSLLFYYSKFPLEEEPLSFNYLQDCIRISCELNLYYRRSDMITYDHLKRPVAYFFIDLIHSILYSYPHHPNIQSDLKVYAETILEKHYYN